MNDTASTIFLTANYPNFPIAVAELCYFSSRTMLLRWHCIATAVALQC